MFNLDESQWNVIRFTITLAVVSWLVSQIADSSFFERFWNQVAVLTLGGGSIRMWMLECAKHKSSS